MIDEELKIIAENIKAKYALNDDTETIIKRIKEVIANDQK